MAYWIRSRLGRMTAQMALGQAKADVKQVCAERDLDRARTIMAEIGQASQEQRGLPAVRRDEQAAHLKAGLGQVCVLDCIVRLLDYPLERR